MSDHSVLSASSSDRWSQCPISITATDEGGSNKAAAEGTLLHAICEGVLTGGDYPQTGSKHDSDGYTFEFTEDMQRDCESYVDFVKGLPWDEAGFSIESRVHYGKALHVPHNMAFGTADCRGFTNSPEGRILEIIDLKMGRKAVNPVENPQAVLYATGVLEDLSDILLLPLNHLVRVTIFQPRLSRTPFQWITTVGHIEAKAASMRLAAQATVRFYQGKQTAEDMQMFPEFVGKHCQYCKRKGACDTFQSTLHAVLPAAGQTVRWDAKLFAMRGVITQYLDDMEQMALDSAIAGTQLPGTKLIAGRAPLPKLRVTDEELRAQAARIGIEKDIVSMKEVWATPTKTRDAFKKAGWTSEQLETILEISGPKPTLTDANDPRKELQINAGNSFTGIAQAQEFVL